MIAESTSNKRKRDRKEEQHHYYNTHEKSHKFNQYFAKSFMSECSAAFKLGPNHTYERYLKSELIPEALDVYGNVFEKMEQLHAVLTEISSFPFHDQITDKKQFMSGATWANCTPPHNIEMECEYDKYRDLCELECANLTEEKRNKYFQTSVFFIQLEKNQLQSLINSCPWLRNICSVLSSKCLIQVTVMSDFVDKVNEPRQIYEHRDLSLSSSLSANMIVFLDNDMTALDGATLTTHLNCTKREIPIQYLRSSVLYMSGKVYHAASTSRAYGIHHASRKPSKDSPGYVNSQRRFLLINCCPYSKLNMLDQLLNCESYTDLTPYSMKQCIFTLSENVVSELTDSEVKSCEKTLDMVKSKYKKN